jgi:hypothetical protein
MLLAFFLQGNPVPEDEFMAKWSTAIGDTFVPSMSLKLLTVRSIPFATIHIYIYICMLVFTGKLPLRFFVFLGNNVVLLSLRRTSD